MTTYASVYDDVLRDLGYSSTTANADQTSRIFRYINEGIGEFTRMKPNYYLTDLEYKPADKTAFPTGTYAVGATGYDAALTWAAGSAARLIGALLVQSGEYNVVRSVTNSTSPFACKLMLPSRFSAGSVTIYERSIVPSNRVTISRVFEGKARWIERDIQSGTVRYLPPDIFFSLDNLTDETLEFPSFFTYTGGSMLLDSTWQLSPRFSFACRIYRTPTLGTGTGDTIDCPDEILDGLKRYAYGQYLIWTADADGDRHINLGLNMMQRARINNG